MAEEVEMKLTAPDRGRLDQIAELDEMCGYRLEEEGRRFIRDVYYDTEGFRLLEMRRTFRVRAYGGICYATFKGEGAEEEGVHRREEEEVEIGDPKALLGGEMDVEPYRRVRRLIGDAPLVETLRVENNRRDYRLVKDGSVYYKMSLDDVKFIGPRGSEGFWEVEIEAAGGGMEDLRRMYGFLRERFNLKASGPSKYATGIGLVGKLRRSSYHGWGRMRGRTRVSAPVLV